MRTKTAVSLSSLLLTSVFAFQSVAHAKSDKVPFPWDNPARDVAHKEFKGMLKANPKLGWGHRFRVAKARVGIALMNSPIRARRPWRRHGVRS